MTHAREATTRQRLRDLERRIFLLEGRMELVRGYIRRQRAAAADAAELR